MSSSASNATPSKDPPSKSYDRSPLRSATDSLLADLGIGDLSSSKGQNGRNQDRDNADRAASSSEPAAPANSDNAGSASMGRCNEDGANQGPDDQALRRAVKTRVYEELGGSGPSDTVGLSAKSVRLALEKQFKVDLLNRRPFIKKEVSEAVADFENKVPLELELAGKEDTNSAVFCPTQISEKGEQMHENTPNAEIKSPSKSEAEEGAPTQDTLASEASQMMNSQESLSSQVSAMTATTAAASVGPMDTRHNTQAEPSNVKLPFIISNKVTHAGPNFPLLVELYKPSLKENAQPVNLKGDTGKIGRVSMLGADGSGKPASPTKKSKKKLTEQAWSENASRRYQPGSKLRLDLKGDVYHGMMANSSACILAVTVNPEKEAKVDYVFNHFLQASYQGNVLKAMGGEQAYGDADVSAFSTQFDQHESDEDDCTPGTDKPSKKKRKK